MSQNYLRNQQQVPQQQPMQYQQPQQAPMQYQQAPPPQQAPMQYQQAPPPQQAPMRYQQAPPPQQAPIQYQPQQAPMQYQPQQAPMQHQQAPSAPSAPQNHPPQQAPMHYQQGPSSQYQQAPYPMQAPLQQLRQATLPPPDTHPSEFRYFDGRASGYSVWLQEDGAAANFAFEPNVCHVGEPMRTEGRVSVAAYEELLALVEEVVRDPNSHDTLRGKGTGLLERHPSLVAAGTRMPIIFKLRDAGKEAIERLLDDMKLM